MNVFYTEDELRKQAETFSRKVWRIANEKTRLFFRNCQNCAQLTFP